MAKTMAKIDAQAIGLARNAGQTSSPQSRLASNVASPIRIQTQGETVSVVAKEALPRALVIGHARNVGRTSSPPRGNALSVVSHSLRMLQELAGTSAAVTLAAAAAVVISAQEIGHARNAGRTYLLPKESASSVVSHSHRTLHQDPMAAWKCAATFEEAIALAATGVGSLMAMPVEAAGKVAPPSR